ncbi:MAG TPA: Hint domain-containing protein, partial [Acetobacteraceae bacterium]|nr:Hint domain-containing protein [Acetobacteraceae bacterium]
YVTLAGQNSLVEQGGVPRGYIYFSADPTISGSLYIHTPQPPSGGQPGQDPQVIVNFDGNDQIYIEESAAGPLTATYTQGAGVRGSLLISSGGTPLYVFNNFRGDAALNYQAVSTTITDPLTGAPDVAAIEVFVCFARGTRIATPEGERRVESLRAGDMVLAANETPARVRWVGQRRLNLAAYPRPELAAPIRIRAGALGENLPSRDLLISPDHALLLDGQLVRAKLLVNGMTIIQERAFAAVTYHHLELDNHGILLAEGVPAESYLDTGNRAFFAGESVIALHPDLTTDRTAAGAWGPYAQAEAEIAPIWDRIAQRALALGFAASMRATTDDPAPRILADGITLLPLDPTGTDRRFAIPAGVRMLRLLSRSFVPADTRPWAGDWRRLGVAVRRLAVRVGAEQREIAMDSPELSRGWQDAERFDGVVWRWTDGDAVLPLAEAASGCVLEIGLHATGAYPLEPETVRLVA